MRKIYIALLLGVMLLGVGVYAGIMYASIPVTIQVNEALSSSTDSVTINGEFPGQDVPADFQVSNLANVPLNVQIVCTETDNANAVTYSSDSGKTVAVAPGDSTITINYHINGDSPVGSFSNSCEFNRVA